MGLFSGVSLDMRQKGITNEMPNKCWKGVKNGANEERFDFWNGKNKFEMEVSLQLGGKESKKKTNLGTKNKCTYNQLNEK